MIPDNIGMKYIFAIKKIPPALYISDLYEVGFYNVKYKIDSTGMPVKQYLTEPEFKVCGGTVNECLVRIIKKLVKVYKQPIKMDVHGPKIGIDEDEFKERMTKLCGDIPDLETLKKSYKEKIKK